MKRLISILLILTLTIVLSSCEGSIYQRVVNDNVEYYTQEEVDELLEELYDEIEYWIENDIEANDGYIENTYVSHSELEIYIQELEQRIEELESEPQLEILFGKFVGVNAYGDESYIVVKVNGVEFEANNAFNGGYYMDEATILMVINGTYYALPKRVILNTYYSLLESED